MTRSELESKFFIYDKNGRQSRISRVGIQYLYEYLYSMCIEAGFFFYSIDLVRNWFTTEYEVETVNDMVADGCDTIEILGRVWIAFLEACQAHITTAMNMDEFNTAANSMKMSPFNPVE